MLEPEQGLLGLKLKELGLLTEDEVRSTLSQAEKQGVAYPAYLQSLGKLDKKTIYEAYADVFDVPFIEIDHLSVSDEAIQLISSDLAHKLKIIPLFKMRDSLNIAMANPGDISKADMLAKKTKCSIERCLATPEDIEEGLNRFYGSKTAMDELLKGFQQEKTKKNFKAKKSGAAAKASLPIDRSMQGQTVMQLVDLILKQAYEAGASDVHIEPEKDILRVRCRVDGVLHESASPPKEVESEIISRIKVMAQMDIAETRVPQDGRIKLNINNVDVDMRVSSMPTVYGENIVIRLLKDSNAVLDLSHLGFTDEMKEKFQKLVTKPFGMVLETGPTGSGKTTSLYAALRTINTIDRNIITVEDPVEYKLPLIRQVPVNNKAGMTFSNALRSILRQDPDVIMIGEIRDSETAQIAVQSALTGHLVLSTLHANTASSVVTRLMDMKVEPFLVSSSVIGVISQRLLRRICERCKEEYEEDPVRLQALQLEGDKKFKTFRGRGCRTCGNSGYKGRVGIFEMMIMNDEIREAIMARASASEIEKVARATGNASLRDDAIYKIQTGQTSVDEVLKAIITE